MSIAQSLLPEFDHEMSVTRRVLERVPEDQLDYKPTPKSMSLARLAGHVAEMGTWGVVTLTREELDFATGEFEALEMKSRAQVLAEFDRIAERGGVLGAMETGYQRGRIQDESMHYEMLKHTGEYPIIGVNTFRNPHGDPAFWTPAPLLAKLAAEGIQARVVSMPSWDIFEETCAKDPAYREQVFPSGVKARVAVEMANLAEELS